QFESARVYGGALHRDVDVGLALIHRLSARQIRRQPHLRQTALGASRAFCRRPSSRRQGPQRETESAILFVCWAVLMLDTMSSSTRRTAMTHSAGMIQPNRIDRISGSTLKFGPSVKDHPAHPAAMPVLLPAMIVPR